MTDEETLDVVERAKLALMSGASPDSLGLVAELVDEVQRLRGVLIDGAVAAFKRENGFL